MKIKIDNSSFFIKNTHNVSRPAASYVRRHNSVYNNYQDVFIKNTQKPSLSFGAYVESKPNMPKYATIPEYVINEMQILPDSENVIKWLVRNCPHRISQESYGKLIAGKTVLTDYDTPEILRQRKILQDDKILSHVPLEVIQELTDKHLKQAEQVPSEKKLIIVTGLPSSGKSTYIKNNGLEKQYFIGDQDIFRQELFELYNQNTDKNDPENIIKQQRFHGGAQIVFQQNILPALLDKGTNIIIPTTGIFEYVERLAKAAKNVGYAVTVIHIDEDIDETIRRGLKRIETESRFFDPLFSFRRAVEINKIVNLAEQSPLIDNIVIRCESGQIIKLSKNYPKSANLKLG